MNALARKLPYITKAQFAWVRDKVVGFHINWTGSRCWCEKCGGQFTGKYSDGDLAVCPHCGAELPVSVNRKRKLRGFDYIQIVTVFRGWQLIRYFLVRWEGGIGEKPAITFQEVIQKWCQPGRPTITRGTSLVMITYYTSIPYSMYGHLSIKNPSYWYREWMKIHVYPRVITFKAYHLTPDERRFPGDFSAEDVLGIIYSIPYFETLYKAGKYKELKDLWSHREHFAKYWPSVRVALRHGFKPKSWGDYFDYLQMLSFLRKDMHSPRYVAPPDYKEIHDLILRQYTNRKDAIERRRREAELLRQAEAEERQRQLDKEAKKSFASRIKKFAGLELTATGVHIKPLMSIQEFREEGKAMHHCVFALGYYKRPDSLILSARDDAGQRIETIEVGLHDGVVVQSRGINNSLTKSHDNIVALVNNNMNIIRQMAFG